MGNGADLHVKNNKGETPLDCAKSHGFAAELRERSERRLSEERRGRGSLEGEKKLLKRRKENKDKAPASSSSSSPSSPVTVSVMRESGLIGFSVMSRSSLVEASEKPE